MSDYIILCEKHILKPSHIYFDTFKYACHFSKNLYNHVLYNWRQAYFKGNILSYKELEKLEREKYPFDYRNMPTAQSAQQTIKRLYESIKSFLTKDKKYKKNPNVYKGKPRLPHYKNKDGFYTLIFTNQNCKLEENIIYFPTVFNDFTLKTNCINDKNFISFQQVQVKYMNNKIYLNVLYRAKKNDRKLNSKRYCGIDLGVENFAALAFNDNIKPLLLKGTYIKSINRYFNKEIGYYQSLLAKCNNKYTSKRIKRLWKKRKGILEDYFHKISRMIVNYCIKHKVGNIVIGKNKNWKSKKKYMQNFKFIPYTRFIEILSYKAEKEGIEVHLINERYTFGTSFLDNELPMKKFYDKKRRKFRGLFISSKGKIINADINAAYQMIKRKANDIYFPKYNWDRICNHMIIIKNPMYKSML